MLRSNAEEVLSCGGKYVLSNTIDPEELLKASTTIVEDTLGYTETEELVKTDAASELTAEVIKDRDERDTNVHYLVEHIHMSGLMYSTHWQFNVPLIISQLVASKWP